MPFQGCKVTDLPEWRRSYLFKSVVGRFGVIEGSMRQSMTDLNYSGFQAYEVKTIIAHLVSDNLGFSFYPGFVINDDPILDRSGYLIRDLSSKKIPMKVDMNHDHASIYKNTAGNRSVVLVTRSMPIGQSFRPWLLSARYKNPARYKLMFIPSGFDRDRGLGRCSVEVSGIEPMCAMLSLLMSPDYRLEADKLLIDAMRERTMNFKKDS